MKLSELLSGIATVDRDTEISGIALDSRRTGPGDVFIALNGSRQHGLRHAEQALQGGAVAIIYDPAGEGSSLVEGLNTNRVQVEGLQQKLATLAAKFYRFPSRRLNIIGVTGTNGKTTCSQLLAQALPECGVIGTLGWGEWGHLQGTANTTPDALSLQNILNQFVEQKKNYVAMEVSSHGLHQGRVNAITFKGAVFTNLSRDHLDYHKDMEEYLQAKLGLFTRPDLDFAVVNLDDTNSHRVLQVLSRNSRRWGFSASGKYASNVECIVARNVRHGSAGISFDAHWRGDSLPVQSQLVGSFNLENLLAVLAVLLALDLPFSEAVDRIAALQPIAGRMEKLGGSGQPMVVIDYAHSPDALEKVLMALKGQGRLLVVFGCGGDRDKGKRAEMGRIAENLADLVMLTDDNPRGESPQSIVDDILSGCKNQQIRVIHDRKTAIASMILQAEADDCILIAGKGHENYQEIGGVKYPFSDLTAAKQALAQWGSSCKCN